jgi:hypothetical protein
LILHVSPFISAQIAPGFGRVPLRALRFSAEAQGFHPYASSLILHVSLFVSA